MSARTSWGRVLIYTHRWLGIGGGALFVAWFVSGVVLMYAGMPALDSEERIQRAPPLDVSRLEVAPAEAVRAFGLTPERVQIGMIGERPVYRLQARGRWAAIYADDGSLVSPLSGQDVMTVAAAFAPEHAQTMVYVRELAEPDQWTFSSLPFFPLHMVRLGDVGDTVIYVSDATGEPVMRTTRSTRRLAYVGAVLHWLYFTPLRRHAGVWAQAVIWLSVVGCLLCISGLAWGVWRWSTQPRYRVGGRLSSTPYAGLMRWHHYAGLVFGLTTCTWIFSGGLSMDPWSWHPSTGPTPEQRRVFSGGALSLETMSIDAMRNGVRALEQWLVPGAVDVVQFQGEPFLLAARVSAGHGSPRSDRRLVSVARPTDGLRASFDRHVLVGAARRALPRANLVEVAWLDEYDAYYYDRSGRQPLPVLRARFDDPSKTWLYVDPTAGAIIRKEERLTRLNRWLYHGLHSLDFPILYNSRPLWDVVVIVLSLGGIGLSVTTAAQSWRRLRRHGRRLTGRRTN